VQVIDRLVCLDGGRIIADAAPQAVLANESVIAAYLGEGLT
jgi:ABC-type branched-subunit amino acid transport system ATPase component